MKRLLAGATAVAFFIGGWGCTTINPTHSVKRIPSSHDGTASKGAEFELGQPWAENVQAAFRPAAVRLAWTPDALLVEAELTDDEVFSSARNDNDPLWQMGDVFEIFAMVEGRKDYVELHVAPNNRRMHLRLPGVGGRATPDSPPLTFEEMKVTPVGFLSEATRTSSGWRVKASIPAKALGLPAFSEGQRLRISFCRYDASSGGEPVLSTTSAHPVVAFHRPDEWMKVILTQ